MLTTRDQAIEVIENYAPVRDMINLEDLKFQALANKNYHEASVSTLYWKDIPTDALIELAYLVVCESNKFYRENA